MGVWEILNSEFTLVLLGFAFTSVVGGLFARSLQERSWKRQTQVNLFRRRYEEGIQFLDEISKLIGRRSFALQRLLWSLDNRNDEQVARLQQENDRAVIAWNVNRYNNRNKIRLLVGDRQANEFLDYRDDLSPDSPASLHYTFVKVHRLVMRTRHGEVPTAEAQRELDVLNTRCSAFLESLTADFAARANALQLLRLPDGDDAAPAEMDPRAFVDITDWLRRRTVAAEPAGAGPGETAAGPPARG